MNKKRNLKGIFFVVCLLTATLIVMCVSVSSALSGRKEEAELQPVIMYVGEQTGQTAPESSDPQAFVKPNSTNTPDYVVLNEGTQMRAVWVGYMSLYLPTEEKIDKIVADCKAIGANTIIFHVRPFGDALYKSQYFPWSHLMTYTQGQGKSDGFDPLAYAVDCAHANGMQLHAWVNPFRIQATGGKLPEALSEDNPYNVWRNDSDPENDTWVVDYKNGKFYNPGVEQVRELIINGMAEIAANYNVDGLHWDDYFYPANDESFDDSSTYQQYLSSGGTMTLIEWRTDNVNKVVRDTYNKIKATNSNCVFGISPAGNINNCLAMGADVYEWGSVSGYVDYLCPQVYWSFESTVAPFINRCKAWRDIVTAEGEKLYIGLALYKAGTDSDNGLWLTDSKIIADQIAFLESGEMPNDGYMIFSYADFSRETAVDAVAQIKEEMLG